jgi:ATP-dependent DNA helicase RecG
MKLIESETVELKKSTSGLRRIKEEYDAAVVKVAFEKVSAGFQVTFYRSEAEIAPENTRKTTRKTTQKIIEEIRKNPRITRKELSVVIGLTEESIKYHIGKMQNKGKIRRIGPDKGGYWEIAEK